LKQRIAHARRLDCELLIHVTIEDNYIRFEALPESD
jgi:hypothetical protein